MNDKSPKVMAYPRCLSKGKPLPKDAHQLRYYGARPLPQLRSPATVLQHVMGPHSATADSCDGVAACIVTPSATADSCDGVAACIVTPCATAESCGGLILSATAESDLLAFRAGTIAVDNGSAAACCCRAEPDTAGNTLGSATADIKRISESPSCTVLLGRFLTYGSIRWPVSDRHALYFFHPLGPLRLFCLAHARGSPDMREQVPQKLVVHQKENQSCED